ncbi:MAG: hypothetical protein V1874_10550 [Spirochaetota bacterium]
MKKSFKVRCYIIQKAGLFFAGCITLNLSATGESVEEAKANLDKVINSYIAVAAKGQKFENFAHLLNRDVPLFMYREYLFCWIMFHISKTRNLFTFSENLPLTICYQR